MSSTRVVGLDIGTTAVRAAELRFSGNRRSGKAHAALHRYGYVPLPPGAVRDGEVVEQQQVVHALRALWGKFGFGTKDVVIGVGNQRVLVRELDLPSMPLPHLRASLPFQVQELLPMSTDDALLDYYPTSEFAGPNGPTVQGLLVAAQRSTVSANIMAVESAGLRPAMVDLNAFALLRALVHDQLAEQTVAVVDIGASVTDIVIVAHGVPRLVRTLPYGGGSVTAAVAHSLELAWPEAEHLKRELRVDDAGGYGTTAAAAAVDEANRTLLDALRNTFVYYASKSAGRGIDVAVLTGGGAHLAGLTSQLSAMTRLPVVLADPLAGLRIATSYKRSDLLASELSMALPVGLAYGVAA